MLSIFCSPARYTQGKNATAFLGREMATLGMEGPALIVAGRSARSLLSEVWCASLGEAGIPYHVHAFGGECSASEINRINARCPGEARAGHHRGRRRQGAGCRACLCR